jgi:multiple sugar transport system permease protein
MVGVSESSRTRLVYYVLIAIALLWTLFPIYWMVLTSIKSLGDVYSWPPKFIFQPTLENYVRALTSPEVSFMQHLGNSIIMSFFGVLGAIFLGVLGAYAIARFHFWGKDSMAFDILTIRMFPPIAAVLPIFVIWNRLNLIDTYPGLIILYVAFNLPLGIWLMRSFFEDLPVELEEAAMIDGCGMMEAFYKITLPLALPGIVATTVICLLFTWNEFLFAFILTGRNTWTLPVALTAYLGPKHTDWSGLTAAATLTMLPPLIIVLLVQRYMVRGLTLGAIKGAT